MAVDDGTSEAAEVVTRSPLARSSMRPALEFAAPEFGTWEQNRAHNPMPVTRLTQGLYPANFQKGFQEGIDLFGAPIVSVTMCFVHGFDYLRFQFLGESGPEGPPDPTWIGEEVMRRAGAAERAFANRIWRDHMQRWEGELRPASEARHRELYVNLVLLDDNALHVHIERCIRHHEAMAHQHHRFNLSSFVPVGDFALQTARWTGRAPEHLLGLFDGYSPISGVWSSEIAPAALALASNPTAQSILAESDEDKERLHQLRLLVPEVDSYVRSVAFRLVDGFDFICPTLLEHPALLLGKLAAATNMGGPPSRAAVEKLEAEVRAEVPQKHRSEFDALLLEARFVYRLRDERGVYSPHVVRRAASARSPRARTAPRS